MSGHTISNGHPEAYAKQDGRTKADPLEQWDTFDIAKEHLARLIALHPHEIADSRSGFAQFRYQDVKIARARVLATGILASYDAWSAADGRNPANGGAPAMITPLALMTGMLLTTQAGRPQLMLELGSLFFGQFDRESRALLGLPDITDKPSLGKVENWQQNAGNAFRRFIADPYKDEDRYRSKSLEETKWIWEQRDQDREAEGTRRLNTFMAAFLNMTWYLQPRRVRRATKRKEVDVTFDGTHVSSPLTRGMTRNAKKLEARISEERIRTAQGKPTPGPVSPFAGWKVTDTAKRDDARPGTNPDSGSNEEYFWGWNATIARRVFLNESDRTTAPNLILAATMGMPSIGTAEAATHVLTQIVEAGHLPGIADADKEYFANALPDRLYHPVRALGWQASTDYRVDRFTARPGHAGVIVVEGGQYCPAMRKTLIEASEDRRQGRIDDETYFARIDARQQYEIRAKERPDANGNVPMMCPAAGASPRMLCPLKQLRASVSRTKAAKLDSIDPTEDGYPIGDDLPQICCQDSVLFTPEDMPTDQQALRYQSKEWREFHRHARNMVEGANSMAKSPKYGALHDHSRRQSRGFAAAFVFLTFILTAMNMKMISDFLREAERDAARAAEGKPPRKPRIQKRRDREYANRYTGTLPGGAPDLELRQQRAAARKAKADQAKRRSTRKRT